MGVVICHFSKIEARLKALYVRLKGISEGGSESPKNKGFPGERNSEGQIFIVDKLY